MMKGKRDATGLQVMEYVVGDEHTFDFLGAVDGSNGKIKAVRPETGCVAGYALYTRYHRRCSVRRANSPDAEGVAGQNDLQQSGRRSPTSCTVDNGKDYTAKAMTGQNRKHRKIDLDFAF